MHVFENFPGEVDVFGILSSLTIENVVNKLRSLFEIISKLRQLLSTIYLVYVAQSRDHPALC